MKNTDLAVFCLKELDAEYTSSRKCLERIPESLFDYKPHPKSMAMGYLTLLVAEMPLWITHMIRYGEVDFATFEHLQAKTTQDIVDHFDENFNGAKQILTNATEQDFSEPFHLKNNGQIIYSMPKIESVSSTINHWVHHRGQLTVYMRLNDIAVPSIYGPSADDKGFS
jgi:uncharacterized damage-inducible protein DinB